MASKMYPFINYRNSIHYPNSCSATIVIVKFLLSLSTSIRSYTSKSTKKQEKSVRPIRKWLKVTKNLISSKAKNY